MTNAESIGAFLLARIAEDEAAAKAEDRTFIVRFQPGRLLAECAAKRQIVRFHTDEESTLGPDPSCSDPDHEPPLYPEGCHTLRALAAIYADHPDYRRDWA